MWGSLIRYRNIWLAFALLGCMAAAPVPPWQNAYDLDGDGKRDRILVEFSGGAHCCYRIGVSLSSNAKTVMLPFQLDGGYVGGLDLSQPDHFTIRTSDGGLPELIMEIETYNGKPMAFDPTWRRRYGIRTHRIAVCFAGGRIRIRDLTPRLPPCRKGGASRRR
jgi:hypothetical protein